MKRTKIIGFIALFALISTLLAPTATAQEAATKKEFKKVQQDTRVLKKDLEKKAIKDARKEAKRLKKEGYSVPAGKLPLEKQIENAWVKQAEIDADGFPTYYVSTQTAVSGSPSASLMQATNMAKMDLAGQIETKVTQMLEMQVSNSELGQDEAATVINTITANKSIISQTLGRTVPLMEVQRKLPNGNYETTVTLGYNQKMATKAAIVQIKKELEKRGDALADKLDKLTEKE